ncbi:hypothetical protein V6N11_047790 [Hibiscus sabdariffa]|uniref:Reverse transcriptase domain-containing protein n=1 Tax=Hibiscus sabdariffa TaxID=183260 RepID=A0ABR2P7Z8_9ROSI
MAQITVLVNGSPTERFKISKGLRQGCPLSTLLFNIVGELLNLMLLKAVSIGLFEGFEVGQGDSTVSISHLQFADDLIIFYGNSESHILNVKRVLRVFKLASGLKLNMKKCRLFGINVDEEFLSSMAARISCQVGNFPSDYLGFHLGAKRNSIALWEPLVAKFSARLTSWKSLTLSFGGSIALIKSILSSLPLYFLAMFRMPSAILHRLNSIMGRFLWGGNEDKRRIHWIKWERICNPVAVGGLGIPNIDSTNKAFLDKWIGDRPLKDLFPCIFVVARNQSGSIFEFGSKGPMGSNIEKDWVKWNKSSDGVFSIKSYKTLFAPNSREDFNWKFLIWNGPYKSEGGIWKCIPAATICTIEDRSIISRRLPKHVYWTPPPSRWLKLNVDGSMKDDGSKGGISGVLKDENKSTLLTFSLKIGSGPPIMAETLAIKFGWLSFCSSPWVGRLKLVIESDCRVVIEWVKNPNLAPDCFKIWIIGLNKAWVDNDFCLRFIPRHCNTEATLLQKVVQLAITWLLLLLNVCCKGFSCVC